MTFSWWIAEPGPWTRPPESSRCSSGLNAGFSLCLSGLATKSTSLLLVHGAVLEPVDAYLSTLLKSLRLSVTSVIVGA